MNGGSHGAQSRGSKFCHVHLCVWFLFPRLSGQPPRVSRCHPVEHMSLPVGLDAQCLWFIGWTQLGCLVRSCSRCTVSVLAGAWGTETGAPSPPLGDPKQRHASAGVPGVMADPELTPAFSSPAPVGLGRSRPSSTGTAFSGGRPVSHHSWAPQATAALAGLSLSSRGPAEVRRLKVKTPS